MLGPIMLKCYLYLLCFLYMIFVPVFADDCSNYFFVQKGNVPVLLTSPHGASVNKRLPHLPWRVGNYDGEKVQYFVDRPDAHTDKVAYGINKELQKRGLTPFMVVAGITRGQIDFNRKPKRAYEHSLAASCYQFYHRSIRYYVDGIRERWGYGFMLDIHGQSRYQDEMIRGTRNNQTIQILLERYGKDATESENGFYYSLRQAGYDVHPKVGEREEYYIGGFTLKRYGSHQKNGIDALQIELNREIRFDDGLRNKVASDIAEAIKVFQQAYY